VTDDDLKGPLGFGHRLRRLRVARGLTQNALAMELKCVQASIADWECGKFYPGFWKLIEIAKHFGVDLDWLLGMARVHEQPVIRYP
jgi:transcriptional regulator with XRE-family HTH domain